MRLKPILLAATASALSSAWLGFIVEGCDQRVPGAGITIRFSDSGLDAGKVTIADASNDANGPTGTRFQVPIFTFPTQAGLSVSLSAIPNTIIVSPATVTTDQNGRATAFALVPYGTSGVVVASGAGASPASINLSANEITLDGGQLDSGVATGPSGATRAVKVIANGAPEGFAVTFSAQPSSITVSPTSGTVGADRSATTYALVPYGTAGVVIASAPGVPSIKVPVANGPLVLTGNYDDAGETLGPTGTTIPLTVGIDGGAPPGFVVYFTALPASISVSPPSATFGPDGGVARAYAFVPYGAAGVVVAAGSGAGSGATPAQIVLPSASITLDGGVISGSVTTGPSALTVPVHVSAQRSAPGFIVTLTGIPSSIVVSPSSVSLGPTGATAYASVPYGTDGVVVVSAPGVAPISVNVTTSTFGLMATVDDAGITNGQAGATVPVSVSAHGAPPGFAVSVVGVPSTGASAIAVTPATLTLPADGGVATAYALVPYGLSGIFVASAPGATAASTPLRSTPLTLCPPTFALASSAGLTVDGGTVRSADTTYSVAVQAIQSGTCSVPLSPAPPGIPIAVGATTTPALGGSGAGTTTSTNPLTNGSGIAQTTIAVPWGATVLVQASGGGAYTSGTFAAAANPLALQCVSVSLATPTLYQITARVVDGTQAVSSVPTTFTIAGSTATPTTSLTNDAGVAAGYVQAAKDGGLTLVQVGVGSSTRTIVVPGDAGGCQ